MYKTISLAVFALLLSDCARTPTTEVEKSAVGTEIYRVPADDLPAMGSEDALVTVVAFTDYECPYCRKADRTMSTLRAEYGRDLRLVIAENPLPMHTHARAAALAALAAGHQAKYEDMHVKLFDMAAVDDDTIERAATRIGLDVARFDADRKSDKIAAELDHAQVLAHRFGVRGAPAFFINGRRIDGAQPIDDFRSVIDEELARARALVAHGVKPARVYDKAIADGIAAVDESVQPPPFDPAVTIVPTEHAPSRGATRPTITVVVFDDFECPYCAKAEATVHALEAAHPGQVRFVFKHRPLPMHEHARLAARASLAAEAQGRFWEYHDVLFTHQNALDRASLVRYAGDLGLDLPRFVRDMDDPDSEARVAADDAEAATLHVKGTPTFFVNGHRVVGAQPLATFEAAAR